MPHRITELVHWPLLQRSPPIAVPNVIAHPSTASAPITVLLYNGQLLCGFNVPIKGLKSYVDVSVGREKL